MRRSLFTLIALGVTLASALEAQVTRSLNVGDRIRVRASGEARKLVLVSVSPETLVVRSPVGTVPETLLLSGIDRLDVGRKRTTWQGAGRGAGYGALLGFIGGAVVGLASGDDKPEDFFAFSAEEKAAGLGVLLAGVGLIGGAAVGAIAPGERWDRVFESRNHVRLSPDARGDVRLTLSRSW